jgi:isocitrate dehydrogenase
MKTCCVVELLGEGISSELSRSVHAVAAALPCRIEFPPVDLSEGNRKTRGAPIHDAAVAAMRRHGVAIKYPTLGTAEFTAEVAGRTQSSPARA